MGCSESKSTGTTENAPTEKDNAETTGEEGAPDSTMGEAEPAGADEDTS